MQKLRRLNFFDRSSVKEEGSAVDVHPGLQHLDISTVCGGQTLWFGDTHGKVHGVDRKYCISSFCAFEGAVQCLKEVEHAGDHHLLALGQDDNLRVKIFSLPKAGAPELIHDMKACGDRMESRALFFDCSADMSLLVVALDVRVMVLRKPKESKRMERTVLAPNVPIYDGKPVGVLLSKSGMHLFVVSERSILSFATDTNNLVFSETLPDEQPSNTACCIFPVIDALLVARSEAVFAYDPEAGNLSATALEGTTSKLTLFREAYFTATCIDATGQGKDRLTVVLAYPQLRAVTYCGQFTDICHVVSSFGTCIYVVCKNRREGTNLVFELKQKCVTERIDILLKKRMFEWATEIATRENLPKEDIANIYSLHGDSLYEKRSFDQALAVYMKTIDLNLPLETSFVIEKFLEAQKVGHIAEFLRRLHDKKLAMNDHTVLLLKCYTKLKDTKNLEDFISTADFCDARTALQVLEESGYAALAARLAEQRHLYDDYVRIQLSRQEDVMTFIKQLPAEEAFPLLKIHGRSLLKRAPEQTMRLIEQTIETNKDVPVDDFMQLCIDDVQLLDRFLRYCIKLLPSHLNSAEPCRIPLDWAGRVLIPTFLEILLREHEKLAAKNVSKASVQSSASEIMALLHRFSWPHVLEAALVTTRMYKFHEGYAYVCEKLEKFQLLFAHCLEQKDARATVEVCKRCGPKEPSLWVQALPYVAKCGSRELAEILASVAVGDLMSPLAVINAFDGNPDVTWADMQPYLETQFRQLSAPIAEARNQILVDNIEVEKMEQEIQHLETKPRIFSGSKCFECNLALEPPSIHFFCLHSYHSYCVPQEMECPVCSADARPRLDLLSQRQMIAPEEFFKYLRGSKGGFDTISEYFGRGVL